MLIANDLKHATVVIQISQTRYSNRSYTQTSKISRQRRIPRWAERAKVPQLFWVRNQLARDDGRPRKHNDTRCTHEQEHHVNDD